MATWKELLQESMDCHDEMLTDIQSTTLTPEELTREFDRGYGLPEGVPFTVWTVNRVYFPVCYDGAEWVSSVSRNPDGKPTHHIGG